MLFVCRFYISFINGKVKQNFHIGMTYNDHQSQMSEIQLAPHIENSHTKMPLYNCLSENRVYN